jgi:hypothetical protein
MHTHTHKHTHTHEGCGAAANAGAHPLPHAGSQDNGNGKLLLPQLDRLHLAFKRSQVSSSASSSSQDQQSQHLPKSVIPAQRRVTEQLTKHWAPFKVLRQRYAGTRFEEQRQLQQACCTSRDPLQDDISEVGRGLSLADTQTGRYGRLYSR